MTIISETERAKSLAGLTGIGFVAELDNCSVVTTNPTTERGQPMGKELP
jgi:hypothetical protein